jgi:hypothetical protein
MMFYRVFMPQMDDDVEEWKNMKTLDKLGS